MERELLETFDAAKKAADATAGQGDSPEAGRCLDALRRLRDIRVNTDILVSTQVSGRLPRLDWLIVLVAEESTFPADACGGGNITVGDVSLVLGLL